MGNAQLRRGESDVAIADALVIRSRVEVGIVEGRVGHPTSDVGNSDVRVDASELICASDAAI